MFKSKKINKNEYPCNPRFHDHIKVRVKGVTLAWACYLDGGGGGSRTGPTKPDCVGQVE